MAGGAIAKDQTPPGSYLKYRATTVTELTSQVSKDASAKLRYAQHFNISADKVTTYFRDNLKLVTLKKPCKVSAWYITKSGKQVSKAKLLPKGTLVFADKNGSPLLAWSCGNPLRASLPQKAIASVKTKEPVTATAGMTEEVGSMNAQVAAATAQAAAPQTMVLANPIETVAAAAVTTPPGFVAQTLPALATTEQVAAAPLVGAAALPAVNAAPIAAVAHSGFSALSWIGGIAGAAGAVALASNNGGGSASVVPVPVPEPGGILTILLGLTTMAPAIVKINKRK